MIGHVRLPAVISNAVKRLTWLIETISVDMSMGNRGKCKQNKNKDGGCSMHR